MSRPEPPQNVRVIDQRGNEWPCTIDYSGEADGMHCWLATPLAVGTLDDVIGIRVGLVPAPDRNGQVD